LSTKPNQGNISWNVKTRRILMNSVYESSFLYYQISHEAMKQKYKK